MTIGVAGRLSWALLTALLGAFWLYRLQTSSAEPVSQDSVATKALGFLCLALSLFWSVTWLSIALLRLNYPFELEWIGGAMRDHVERFLHHLPYYVRPGGGWFPYEYPPLYPWVCALLLKLVPLPAFVIMRSVSILSTVGCTILIGLWIKRLLANVPQSNFWSIVASGLFIAAYRMTGAWYDLERLDMLFLFLSLLGIYTLGEGWQGTLVSAIAFVLAFFTKQQAILFILAGAVALWLQKAWKPLKLFVGITVIGCALTTLLLNFATRGWFWFYCFRVPLSNGIHLRLALLFLYNDLPLYAPLLVGIALGMRLALPNLSIETKTVLIAMSIAALAGSWLSRAHWGGDQNVLMTAYLFFGIVFCVVAAVVSQERSYLKPCLLSLTVAQFLAIAYNPMAQLPQRRNLEAGQRFTKEIQTLQREGEVLCLDHGGFTSPPHFQIMGLLDVMNTLHRIPLGLEQALEAKRYTAVVTEGLPGTHDVLGRLLYANYQPVQKQTYTTSWVVTGFLTPSAQLPVYIWRPKRPTPDYNPISRPILP